MQKWQQNIHEVIFEADTPKGKVFDISLLVCIVLSVVVVLLESVQWVKQDYGYILNTLEWSFTILFTIEYLLRLICTGKPWKYVISFYGIVDLLAVLPTYIAIFWVGSQSLLVIRVLRLLRVFRIFKLVRFLGEAKQLSAALRSSVYKMAVFMITVIISVIIMGTIMYLIEGNENGFTSIPRSIYWAVVTITTVGYGDIIPVTSLGQFISSILMILGYGLIAVPTGIVSVELANVKKEDITTQACMECSLEGHAADAAHCKYCGAKL
jgi:voltage-gated potassium channel